jgi:hypothetical protein
VDEHAPRIVEDLRTDLKRLTPAAEPVVNGSGRVEDELRGKQEGEQASTLRRGRPSDHAESVSFTFGEGELVRC